MAGKQRKFMGKPITKETINLGIGGQLVRDDDFPEIPAEATVTFQAKARFDNVKHHFTGKGTVEEALIFTIDAATFEVLDVEEKPEQLELAGEPAGDEPADPGED